MQPKIFIGGDKICTKNLVNQKHNVTAYKVSKDTGI